MSTQLGVGVRVFVKWCPRDQCADAEDAVTGYGRITGGPFPPGLFVAGRARVARFPWPSWNVAMDSGARISVAEQLLEPVDDGDPVAVEQTREVEA